MKNILFVDDETRVLDGIRRIFHSNRDRWSVHFAASGEEALAICEKMPFDLVISDMRMPGMDGATLLGVIRERYPDAARIVLSGYSEASLATRSVSVAHQVLAKPCKAADLEAMIDRVLALQNLVMAPEIRRVVGTVSELPSLSTAYQELTQVINDSNISVDRVARIIETDVAMTAKVLQLTNSAFFGLPQRVTSLRSAVSILGMDTIKNLALASEAFRVFAPQSRAAENACRSIQKHALETATIAAKLPVDSKIRDLVVVAALLHDVGKLFLAYKLPDIFNKVIANTTASNSDAFSVEQDLLGTSHAEIGAYLLGLWGIPQDVVEAIAHHHHLERIEHKDLDCNVAVHIADLLAHELYSRTGYFSQGLMADGNRQCLDSLGLIVKLDEFRSLCRHEDPMLAAK